MDDGNVQVDVCQWRDDAPFAYSMTYDEGTVDCLANALPVHEKYGIPGHVDVVVGQLGRPRDCYLSSINGYVHMSAEELKTLVEHGWSVGNHSWSHYVWPIQPGLDLWREVVWSKYRLEEALDRPVRVFTLPNGEYNYAPVIDLVRKHYLACAAIFGSPNREGFDLYKIGNFAVSAGKRAPHPGWSDELNTENLTLEYLRDAWLYETTHLCMKDVPQPHKCVTPETLIRRFEKLHEISRGKMWAANVEDVIDYELMRRSVKIENIRRTDDGKVQFDILGAWPVGVMNSLLTFRVQGAGFADPPRVELDFHADAPTIYQAVTGVEKIIADGTDWLLTMHVAPQRTVTLH